MTGPVPGQYAPYGYLWSGTPAETLDQARDDMISVFRMHSEHLEENESYYKAEHRPKAVGMAIPPDMRKLLAQVGYPRIYVNSLSERLDLEGFRLGNADEADSELWDWWQANNLDVQAPLGHTESLVHGRSYITISQPDPDDVNADPTVPIICVEPPHRLFAVIDPRTRKVTQAIRVIFGAKFSAQRGLIVAATLYLPNQTTAWALGQGGQWVVIQNDKHDLGLVPVVPIANQTLLSDIYGTSEITPELRSITDAASRILMDMQGAAELMGIPQRILFGVKPDDLGVDPKTGESRWDAYLARILAFEDQGTATQFSAAELRNFTDALDALDRKVAAYCGLPPYYLSYSSENPASAEAIESSEARLVKNAERKTLIFGGAWEQAMRIAYRMMNGALPSDYYRMEAIWCDPSTPTYAAKADAASKLYANGAGVIPKEQARVDMGYSIAQRDEMREWDKQEDSAMQLAGMYGAPAPGQSAQGQGPSTNPASPTETSDAAPVT